MDFQIILMKGLILKLLFLQLTFFHLYQLSSLLVHHFMRIWNLFKKGHRTLPMGFWPSVRSGSNFVQRYFRSWGTMFVKTLFWKLPPMTFRGHQRWPIMKHCLHKNDHIALKKHNFYAISISYCSLIL